MSRVYQSEGVLSEEGAEPFLAHLPPDTPVYSYNPRCAIESLSFPYAVEDTFLVLKHFPADLSDEDMEQLPGRCDYSPSLQILIIKMPGQPHEEAASRFDLLIGNLAYQMKVHRRMSYRGATLVETPERQKEADRSWAPARQGREFPTVALEIGFPETTQKLERDIAWWINRSKGEVRMGITIDIKRQSHSIEIKSWTPAIEPLPHKIHITAAGRQVVDKHISNPPPPRMAQRILIKRGRNGSNPAFEGEDLVIPFHTLMLDDPGEGEGDFVLTAEMLLHDLAERIWDAIYDAELIRGPKY